MYLRAATALLLWFLPAVALSATFAQSSLFLSKPSVTEGETVLIHATVSNDSGAPFKGELLFTEGAGALGAVPVSLDPGEAQVASISWKPSAGTHTVVAKLREGSDILEESKATFSVAAKPQPQAAAAVESSQGIQNGIASLSPAAASATAPLFTMIDGGRAAIASVLDGQINQTKQALDGEVLGAEESRDPAHSPMGGFLTILRTLYLYLLTLLSFLIGNAGVFYPVFALLVLVILWKLVARFRSPRYA